MKTQELNQLPPPRQDSINDSIIHLLLISYPVYLILLAQWLSISGKYLGKVDDFLGRFITWKIVSLWIQIPSENIT